MLVEIKKKHDIPVISQRDILVLHKVIRSVVYPFNGPKDLCRRFCA